MEYISFLNLENLHKTINKKLREEIYNEIAKSSFIGGKTIKSFESKWSNKNNQKFSIACANGTDALELIFEAMEIREGNEVIVPAFSFFSSLTTIVRCNATPVFCDIDPATFNIDPDKIREKITPKTKAVIAVHLHGLMSNMGEIHKICELNGIYLIEDAAQAHGSRLNGNPPGEYADAVAYSFYPTKNLGALGDAGAVTTNDPQLAAKIRVLGNYGSIDGQDLIANGRNSRMDSIQASILIKKLDFLDIWNKERRRIAHQYNSQLQDNNHMQLPHEPERYFHTYHHYVIKINKDFRSKLVDYLRDRNIETKIHYPIALNNLNVIKHLGTKCPEAESAADQSLSLPIYPGLSSQQISYICDNINTFFLNK